MKPRRKRALERMLDEPGRPLHSLPSLAHHALSTIEHFAPVMLAASFVLGLAALTLRHARQRRLARGARVVRIGVPPDVDAGGGALLLWSALHDLIRPHLSRLIGGQPHLAWEVAGSKAGTTFRLWVPESIPPGLIERAVSSAWPGASTSSEPAASHDPIGETLAASELTLSGPDWFSLNAAMKPDPLPLILGQLSGLRGEQRALVQVLARPATAREQRRLRAAARRLRAGISPHRLVRLMDFFITYRKPKLPTHDPTISPDVRDVMGKSTQPLYRCLVRVAVSARSRDEARGRIYGILGGFAAYEGRVGLRRRGCRYAATKLRNRRLGRRAFLASTGELAALAHLPGEEAIPGVVMAGAREVAPPPGLPAQGKPLGLGVDGRPVNLSVVDARRHMHVLGPTGVGKTTLIARLVLADFDAGRGAVVIDPKGDLVEDLLARIPAGREDEVDLLDPLDEAPPGLNVLDSLDRDLGVDQLVGIFSRVFERNWGPRTDDILRAAVLTLSTASPTSTLADIPRLLTDRSWQKALAAKVDDPVLGPFWEWYGELSDPLRAQVSGPLLNKLRAFLLRRPVAIVSVALVAPDPSAAFLGMTDLLGEGKLCFPNEVVEELERIARKEAPLMWAKGCSPSRTNKGAPYPFIEWVGQDFPDLVDATARDTQETGAVYVVAQALALKDANLGVTVVTNDIRAKPTRASTQEACVHFKIPSRPCVARQRTGTVWRGPPVRAGSASSTERCSSSASMWRCSRTPGLDALSG
jgi:hypothetical protein